MKSFYAKTVYQLKKESKGRIWSEKDRDFENIFSLRKSSGISLFFTTRFKASDAQTSLVRILENSYSS